MSGATEICAPKIIFTFTFALDNLAAYPAMEPDGDRGEIRT